MVDVSSKKPAQRIALSEAAVYLPTLALQQILRAENIKGDVLSVSRIAGISAAKVFGCLK